VNGKFGQMTAIVGDCALTLAGDYNFLLKLGEQFRKTCYIRAGSLKEVWLFFFMIDIELRMNQKVTSFWLL